jgi:dihydroxyacid dehydratase/phosphogluconate dehydratase
MATPTPTPTPTPRKTPADLRSARWFAPDDLRSFGHRSRAMQMGYGPEDWKDKPVIAIVNTWSDINPCHSHFKQRVDDVRRGILQAGGFPLELPAISLAENFVKPTTMLYRNLLAIEAEELARSHPVDGAVLMGGCDKTTPGAGEAGGARHAAPERRAHERHPLRRQHPACRARGLHRRPAGLGQDRRLDHRGRAGAPHPPGSERR